MPKGAALPRGEVEHVRAVGTRRDDAVLAPERDPVHRTPRGAGAHLHAGQIVAGRSRHQERRIAQRRPAPEGPARRQHALPVRAGVHGLVHDDDGRRSELHEAIQAPHPRHEREQGAIQRARRRIERARRHHGFARGGGWHRNPMHPHGPAPRGFERVEGIDAVPVVVRVVPGGGATRAPVRQERPEDPLVVEPSLLRAHATVDDLPQRGPRHLPRGGGEHSDGVGRRIRVEEGQRPGGQRREERRFALAGERAREAPIDLPRRIAGQRARPGERVPSSVGEGPESEAGRARVG